MARHKSEAGSQRDAKFVAQAEFRYQIRRFLHFSEKAARRAGLHPQQYQLLLAIRGLPHGHEATIGHLAERLQLQHHSAVELINRAERRRLVKRAGGHEDRRQVIVRLTQKGETLLQKLAHEHRNELSSAAPQLVRSLKALTWKKAAKGRGREKNR